MDHTRSSDLGHAQTKFPSAHTIHLLVEHSLYEWYVGGQNKDINCATPRFHKNKFVGMHIQKSQALHPEWTKHYN